MFSRPIWPASAYIYESMDDLDAVFAGTKPGYVYSRYASPTVVAFETAVASLEGSEAAQAYSSGMAAIHAAFQPTLPAPRTHTLAGRTPGTPPSSTPRPPL